MLVVDWLFYCYVLLVEEQNLFFVRSLGCLVTGSKLYIGVGCLSVIYKYVLFSVVDK